ncbi:MAG: carboxymuconolactone decarboxylase family protein [Deinococcus-Thermus bacterium]|jgi:AhpD family alkylhydroperoxidase|nr:carboxymuconolactone decarboxylase family protein [Deinococcota bacterium]
MDWQAYMTEIRGDLRTLNKAAPEACREFGALSSVVKQEGALSLREREAIALGIAIAMRCEPCIGFHCEALSKAGGTREQLGDVLAVALQMGGGPSLMYAAKTLAAWDALVAEGAATE